MLCIASNAQNAVRQFQAEAVSKYPELGIEGSDFNRRFLSEYNKRRASVPTFFNEARWPVILADEIAENFILHGSQKTGSSSANSLPPGRL
jgi:hypothetical protein